MDARRDRSRGGSPPIAATFKVMYRDESHPQQPMQLALEPPLAPYVPPDLDTALGDEALGDTNETTSETRL